MFKNSDRVWIIQEGILGTVRTNPEGRPFGFQPAQLIADTAKGLTVYFQSAGLRKCFDFEPIQEFMSLDHLYCQEYKCALARSIVVKYAGSQTDPIVVPESHFIPLPVDELTNSKLQEAYIKRVFKV